MVRPATKLYKLLQRHKHDGVQYEPGAVLELTLAQGSWLVGIGVVTTAPRGAVPERTVAKVEQRAAAPARSGGCGGCGWK